MAWYAAIRGLLPFPDAYPTVFLYTFVTRDSVSARVLGFLIICAVIKRRMGFLTQNVYRGLSRLALSYPRLQRRFPGLLFGVLLSFCLGNGMFIFSNPPQGTPGDFKKEMWSVAYFTMDVVDRIVRGGSYGMACFRFDLRA